MIDFPILLHLVRELNSRFKEPALAQCPETLVQRTLTLLSRKFHNYQKREDLRPKVKSINKGRG